MKNTKLSSNGELVILTSNNLADENSFDSPKAISPVVETVKVSKGKVGLELKSNSLAVVKIKIY